MDYLSAKQVAEKWGVSERWVQKLCENSRVPGAARLGGTTWAIPKDAPKPPKHKTGKRPARDDNEIK